MRCPFSVRPLKLPSWVASITTVRRRTYIHAAIERGVTLLDPTDFYASGHNELLIGKAIAGRRDQVQLSVKLGALRGPDGSGWHRRATRDGAPRASAYVAETKISQEC